MDERYNAVIPDLQNIRDNSNCYSVSNLLNNLNDSQNESTVSNMLNVTNNNCTSENNALSLIYAPTYKFSKLRIHFYTTTIRQNETKYKEYHRFETMVVIRNG